jgi:putative MATE family efflux protein
MTKPHDTNFSDKALLLLFLPIAGELALHYTVGIVDSMMVSSVGEAAVSGVSLMDFVVSFFNSLLTALAVGGGVVVGQHLGNSQSRESSGVALQTILLLGLSGVLLSAIVYALQPVIVNRLFGPLAPEVRSHATAYFSLIAASLPFLGIYSAAASVFRAYGNTRLPLRTMVVANLLNVAGNAAAIYLLDMGTRGVAAATLGARIFAAAAITAMLLRRMSASGTMPQICLHLPTMRRIARLGIPYSFENGMFYLGRVLVLIMVASFGTASIAANAVTQAIILFQVLPGMAAVTGITVVVSRCVGAGSYTKARYYTRHIVKGIYLAHIVSCIAVTAFLPTLMRLYNLSPEAIGLTRQLVMIHALFVVTVWPASYALPATFRAAGDTRFPMRTGVACMLFCRVGFSWLLGIEMGMGVVGVWLGMFGDWIVKGTIFLLRYRSCKWQQFRLVE